MADERAKDLRTLSNERFEQEVAEEITKDLEKLRGRETKSESES